MENSNQFTNERSAARRHTAVSVITYILLTLWALIVLFPFYWMVLTSVKSYSSYNAEHIPSFFTLTPTMQNYADAFTAVPLGKYLLNTLIFTSATTAIMMVVITLSAFAFARLEFPGKKSGLYLISLPDDDSKRACDHHQLCDHYQPGYAKHLPGTDPSLCHLRILHLPSERKFRAGSGRALPGSQGGRHLRSEIPVQGYDPHLQAHYGDHRHPEGN